MSFTLQHIKVFIAYAREDKEVLQHLRTQLRGLERKKRIQVWYDGEILPSENWNDKIRQQLEVADIFVLLVSSDFIASDYAQGVELKKALEKHRAGTAKVFPVIVRDCFWEEEDFSKIQVLPTDAKPVQSQYWKNWDTPLKQVVKAINRAAQTLQAERIAENKSPIAPDPKDIPPQILYAALVKKASYHYAKGQWERAVAKYEQALHLPADQSETNKDKLQKRIQNCHIEMGFAKAMRAAKTAFRAKDLINTSLHLERAVLS